jgi:hypothetical protein
MAMSHESSLMPDLSHHIPQRAPSSDVVHVKRPGILRRLRARLLRHTRKEPLNTTREERVLTRLTFRSPSYSHNSGEITLTGLRENILALRNFEDAACGYFASAVVAKRGQIEWLCQQRDIALQQTSSEYQSLIDVLERELTILTDQVTLMKLDITSYISPDENETANVSTNND